MLPSWYSWVHLTEVDVLVANVSSSVSACEQLWIFFYIYKVVISFEIEHLWWPWPGYCALVFHSASVGLTTDQRRLARPHQLAVVSASWFGFLDGSAWRTQVWLWFRTVWFAAVILLTSWSLIRLCACSILTCRLIELFEECHAAKSFPPCLAFAHSRISAGFRMNLSP